MTEKSGVSGHEGFGRERGQGESEEGWNRDITPLRNFVLLGSIDITEDPMFMTLQRRKQWRGKASDVSARLAQEPRVPLVGWHAVTYSVQIPVSREFADAIRGYAFNLSKPGYYLSHGKAGRVQA